MQNLIEVKNLKKYFWTGTSRLGKRDAVRAVDDVSFNIQHNEVLSLVGESGCGKTTCGKVILRILDPTDGRILFDGNDITHLQRREMIPFRKRMMIIYQDPFGSLDPRMTVKRTISEPIEVHGSLSKMEREQRIAEVMRSVGLPPEHMNRYPHEFSGGQRQRIGIARALANNPDFLVADESVSALDVSIQAQIINLLQDLQRELGITLLFISHDLSVVRHISDRVAVMYLGMIVEMAAKEQLFENPKHPYTQALMKAIPIPDPSKKKKGKILMGDVPSPINPPAGCRFHPRCPHRMDICDQQAPGFREVATQDDGIAGHGVTGDAKANDAHTSHAVACYLY